MCLLYVRDELGSSQHHRAAFTFTLIQNIENQMNQLYEMYIHIVF